MDMYIVYTRLYNSYPIWKELSILEYFTKYGKGWKVFPGFRRFGKNAQKRWNYWAVETLRLLGCSPIGKIWKSWEILEESGDFGRDGRFWEEWEILGGVGDFGRVGEVAEG
jgi:hypothetical protein